jgi:hypothetical protein
MQPSACQLLNGGNSIIVMDLTTIPSRETKTWGVCRSSDTFKQSTDRSLGRNAHLTLPFLVLFSKSRAVMGRGRNGGFFKCTMWADSSFQVSCLLTVFVYYILCLRAFEGALLEGVREGGKWARTRCLMGVRSFVTEWEVSKGSSQKTPRHLCPMWKESKQDVKM